MTGALQYLHSPEGQAIAQDPDANVVILLPDGVRNYMSKPWFLDVAADPTADAMRNQIKQVIGRELNDAGSVVKQAKREGAELESGQGVEPKQ